MPYGTLYFNDVQAAVKGSKLQKNYMQMTQFNIYVEASRTLQSALNQFSIWCKVGVPKLEAFKRSVQYTCTWALQWKNLPSEYRNINSFASFKSKQKFNMLNGI